MIEDRILPQCLEIERAILTSFIVDHEIFLKYSSQIKPEYFYNTFHGKVFSYMIESSITDLVLLGEKFPNETVELAELINNIGSFAVLDSLISELRDRWYRRYQISMMYQAIENLFTNFNIPALAQSEETISALCINDNVKEKPESIHEIWPKMMNQFEIICRGTGIKTGLNDIDLFLGTFMPGEYILLAARPSMGKTSLALQIARKAATDGFPVLIFSLETLKNVICARTVFGGTETSYDKALKGQLKEIEKMCAAAGAVSGLPIYVDDSPDITVGHIQSTSEYYIKKFGVELIIIDHLGLIKTKSGRSRNEEVSEISSGVKTIGHRFKIPILALNQLSRACELRHPPRPILSDLRDSGSLEQDADKVIFIYREEYYKRDSEKKGIAEITVAKNKNGKTGYDEVAFIEETMNFKNLEKSWPQARTEY
jgi:replicative DNA helicase